MEKFPTLRQSLLSAYDTCALAAKFGLEFGEGWSGHPQGRGQIFHRFAAKALEEMARQGESGIEVDVALAILHECLRQEDVEPRDVVNVPMAQVYDLYWVVKKWSHENVFDIEHLVDVEQRLSGQVSYEVEGRSVERVLTGQLDALFITGEQAQEGIVIDWKDTWALPAPTEVSFEGYFQQRFYGWLVMKAYKSVESVTLREFYVRYSEPREAIVHRHELQDIEDELVALAVRFDRSVGEDIWPPSPGKHCSWCLKPSACPIPAFARGEGQIDNDEQAEKVAARLVVAKATYDQAYRALKAFADRHGPVPIASAKGNRVWGYKRSERVERPEREVLEAALAMGDVDLDKLYPKKTSTRFSQFTPEPEEKVDDDLIGKLQESLKVTRK